MENNMNGAANAAAQFMDFLKKFGVIGLAIGTVVGGAVKDYVAAIVTNVVDPLTKYVLGMINFSPTGGIKLPGSTLEIGLGALISATISFLVLMLLVYITVNVLISKFMSEHDMKNVG